MTFLAVRPVDDPEQLDLLNLIADNGSVSGLLAMEDFKAACLADARANGGMVHPSRVSALLHDRFGELNPRSLSAKWAGACGPNGFLDKSDVPAPIDPKHSKGNGNKASVYRVWRDRGDVTVYGGMEGVA